MRVARDLCALDLYWGGCAPVRCHTYRGDRDQGEQGSRDDRGLRVVIRVTTETSAILVGPRGWPKPHPAPCWTEQSLVVA